MHIKHRYNKQPWTEKCVTCVTTLSHSVTAALLLNGCDCHYHTAVVTVTATVTAALPLNRCHCRCRRRCPAEVVLPAGLSPQAAEAGGFS